MLEHSSVRVDPLVLIALLAAYSSTTYALGRRGHSWASALLLAAGLLLAVTIVGGASLAALHCWTPTSAILLLATVTFVAAVTARLSLTSANLLTNAHALTLQDRGWLLAGILIVGVGVALRHPPQPRTIPSRDQATHALHAELLAAHGGTSLVDLTLVSRANDPTFAALDLRATFPVDPQRAIFQHYEAAYRPGFYLADREQGLVVSQFFHGYASVLALAIWIGGSFGLDAALAIQAGCTLIAALVLGQRLFGWSPWALFLPGVLAFSPQVIWVHRHLLNENPTLILYFVAALATVQARHFTATNAWLAAFMLGACAWLRGNAFITLGGLALVVLAHGSRSFAGFRGACWLYLSLLAGSWLVHAFTSFPYMVDEIGRLVPHVRPDTAAHLAIGGVLALAAGAGLVQWAGRLDRSTIVAQRLMQGMTVLALLASMARVFTEPSADGASRLHGILPVLGWPLLALALASAWASLRHFGRTCRAVDTALAWTVVTLLLYAPAHLPRFDLYYYGRYLVPEILPVAALLAAWGGQHMVGKWAPSLHPLGSTLLASFALVLVVFGCASPLVFAPWTRMSEMDGAKPLATWMLRTIVPDATLIAGGQGWRSDQAWQQGAGIVALRERRNVLPSFHPDHTYALMSALLGDSSAPTRPLYLLRSELAPAFYTESQPGSPLHAVIEGDVLAPFVLEQPMVVHAVFDRLMPTVDRLPDQVVRQHLRFELAQLALDRPALAQLEVYRPHADHLRDQFGHRLDVVGLVIDQGRACLVAGQTLVLERPSHHRGVNGGWLWVINHPASEVHPIHAWQHAGESVFVQQPAMPKPWRGASLGPLPMSGAQDKLVLEVRRSGVDTGACALGHVLALQWIPAIARASPSPAAYALASLTDDAWPSPSTTIWHQGLAYRPLPRAGQEDPRQSVLLTAQQSQTLHCLQVVAANHPIDAWLLIHAPSVQAEPHSQLVVRVHERVLATLPLPSHATGWISPPIAVQLDELPSVLQVEIRPAHPSESTKTTPSATTVALRDATLVFRQSIAKTPTTRLTDP